MYPREFGDEKKRNLLAIAVGRVVAVLGGRVSGQETASHAEYIDSSRSSVPLCGPALPCRYSSGPHSDELGPGHSFPVRCAVRSIGEGHQCRLIDHRLSLNITVGPKVEERYWRSGERMGRLKSPFGKADRAGAPSL
jgi:hypothetical protein